MTIPCKACPCAEWLLAIPAHGYMMIARVISCSFYVCVNECQWIIIWGLSIVVAVNSFLAEIIIKERRKTTRTQWSQSDNFPSLRPASFSVCFCFRSGVSWKLSDFSCVFFYYFYSCFCSRTALFSFFENFWEKNSFRARKGIKRFHKTVPEP